MLARRLRYVLGRPDLRSTLLTSHPAGHSTAFPRQGKKCKDAKKILSEIGPPSVVASNIGRFITRLIGRIAL